MQERRNSSALAMELHLSCTNPSICTHYMLNLKFWLEWLTMNFCSAPPYKCLHLLNICDDKEFYVSMARYAFQIALWFHLDWLWRTILHHDPPPFRGIEFIGTKWCICCWSSNVRCTKSQNFDISHLLLQLSLPNPLEPGVMSKMKM